VVSTPVRRLLDIAGVSSWFDVLAQTSGTRCPHCEARVLATAFECQNCGHDFVRS
jgi:DNA-directed RNA polymerase subunit RPC12/RpoP